MTKAMKELHAKYNGFEDFGLSVEGQTDCEGNFLPGADVVVWLWGYGTYESSSVLAGQFRQARLDSWDTVAEAEAATGLKTEGSTGPVPASMLPALPDCPPPGFDPQDAGEVWGEDDY